MAETTQWYKAVVIAEHPALPAGYKPGVRVSVSVAACGVRIWGAPLDDWGMPHEGPAVVTPEVAKVALRTERIDGKLVRETACIEGKWSFYFSGGN
jgi:hypothetical protein